MDKNMIYIDDLVKQRLSGGEEKEMPGSWLRMRELLDKEMPERPVAGFAWRRMLGVTTGLALLSLVTVGSYTAIHSTRFNGDGAKNATSAAVGKGISTHSTRQSITAKNEPISALNGSNNIANEVESNIGAADSKAITSHKAINPGKHTKSFILETAGSKSAIATSSVSTSSVATASVAEVARSKEHIASLNNIDQKGLKAGVAHEKLSPAAAPTALDVMHTETALDDVATNATVSNVNVGKAVSENKIVSSKNTNNSNTGKDNNKLTTLLSKQSVLAANSSESIEQLQEASAPVADNTKLTTTPAPKQPELPKDSMKKMTVIQRYVINPINRTGRLTADTVSFGKMAVDRQILASLTGNKAEQEAANAITPASSATPSLVANMNAELGGNAVMVPLSNLKVQSKKTNRWNTRTFDEVVRDVKFNLSQTRFYPGVSGGINSYLFGPSNLGGIQLGLFGLFTFGETWGAMAELKYVHRFNNGYVLSDNYMNVKRNGGNSYLQNEVRHFFKFSSLQSIEMPLALRYAAGRLNLFGGFNFGYNFAVNAEESSLMADSVYTPTSNPQWTNSKPTLTYNDFASRFSVGGLAGLSWEVSPSVQIDFRATKNFWDNATGGGATKVSQKLYSAPSFQMSLFYRLNQKNQIPKAK
jgi:hypothetical protein